MQNNQRKMDQYLLEAIDETLGSLGEPVRNHIYIHLENQLSIPRNSLPERIEEFSHLLQSIFGNQAKLIEIKCMRVFYSKLKRDQHLDNLTVTFQTDNLTFLNYTKKFREQAANKQTIDQLKFEQA